MPKTSFQFHKGTIRTPAESNVSAVVVIFQFHKGTIRTFIEQTDINIYDDDFNSIKVRLERPLFGLIGIIIPLFQFHKGTIRTFGLPDSPIAHYYFNSIKVRLEPRMEDRGKYLVSISIP